MIIDIRHREDDVEPRLHVESDGHGRYKVSGYNLPRQDGRAEYETDDGFHVMGLIALLFGASDGQEYLLRRLDEREAPSGG